LPFQLTNAQKGEVKETGSDISSQAQMNRFVTGDVGSGKLL
jgi:RecG-like helicase